MINGNYVKINVVFAFIKLQESQFPKNRLSLRMEPATS